jgi:L-threonylcarbamoyladenylate synthase
VRVLALSSESLAEAVALLGAGEVVAIPTDTVYGLAARLDDDVAIAGLFRAKDRPATLPVAVLCATTADAIGVAATWPAAAEQLAQRFWPGPLTVVVAADHELAARLGANGAVGVRVPRDPTCHELLAATGPLAVTSANRHGEDPATTAADVAAALNGVTVVLDGGRRDGAVSTVVDLTGAEPCVVREGAIPSRDVLAVLDG